MTNILSTFCDTIYQSKKNSQIDTFVLVLFLIGLILSINLNNIYYFAYTVLFKSILSFFLKLRFIKKYIIELKILILQNAIFISAFFFEIRENYYLFIFSCFAFFILLIKTAPINFLKKEFFK